MKAASYILIVAGCALTTAPLRIFSVAWCLSALGVLIAMTGAVLSVLTAEEAAK